MTNFHNIIITAFIVMALSTTSTGVATPPPSAFDTAAVLDAIKAVETGGCADPNAATGDNGRAIGAFQIHKCYWQDAVEYDKTIGGCYADCRNEAYARRIVVAYLSRYCRVWSVESVSRIHNGGCNILKRQGTTAWNKTTKYWYKVENALTSR